MKDSEDVQKWMDRALGLEGDDHPERTYWYISNLATNSEEGDFGSPARRGTRTNSNLASSLLESGLHSPALDIDFPCRLVPSSTPGHFHLYLDGLELPWEKYLKLLEALAAAGVVQEGFLSAARQRKMTLLRKPGVKKKITKSL